VTASYDFLEPKALALPQDVYTAPNSVIAEWHERQLHLPQFSSKRAMGNTDLCAATHQLAAELTERCN